MALRDRGAVPLLMDGTAHPPVDDKLYGFLESTFAEQYGPCLLDTYRQLDPSERVIILDDYHKLVVRPEAKVQFLSRLQRFAGRIVLLANDLGLGVTDLVARQVRDESESIRIYRIQPLGHAKRIAIAEKWLLLGRDVDRESPEFSHELSTITKRLDTLVGRSYVPAYPLYVLAVLQGHDAGAFSDTQARTHGYFYELFIRLAIARDEHPTDFDVFIGYLSYLAYEMFRERVHAIGRDEFDRIHARHNELYAIKRDSERMLRDLVRKNILAVSGDEVRFRYPYIYYYFIGLSLRDHIAQPDVRDHIRSLSQTVHIEEHASILLFLTHLSKDPLILEQLLGAAGKLYPDTVPAAMKEDVKFLNEGVARPVPVVYEGHDPVKAREEMLESWDEREREGGATKRDDAIKFPAMNGPAAADADPIVGGVVS